MITHLDRFGAPTDLTLIQAISNLIWLPGLRDTGYQIAHAKDIPALLPLQQRCLAALPADPIHWDCVLIRYPDGASIPTHLDVPRPSPVPLQHHRLFLLVQAAAAGGVLTIDGLVAPFAEGDAVVFEPCEIPHSVSPVVGTRLVFTVGVWTVSVSP